MEPLKPEVRGKIANAYPGAVADFAEYQELLTRRFGLNPDVVSKETMALDARIKELYNKLFSDSQPQPKVKPTQEQLVDAIRSAMYGTDDVLEEVGHAAELLAKLDGVPVNYHKNRLYVAVNTLKYGYADASQATSEEDPVG